MELKGKEFGNIFASAGTRGFAGEGYWHHKFLQLLPGFDFSGSTFIAKTITLVERMPKINDKSNALGNLSLNRKTLQPIRLFPDCIKVSLLKGEVLNAVGATNIGTLAMLDLGIWQKIQEPFGISFMAVGKTRQERLLEIYAFKNIFNRYLPTFSAPVFLQINKSCPSIIKNINYEPQEWADEIIDELRILSKLGIPVGIKINVLTPIEIMKKVSDSGFCNFIEIPNALPFGAKPERIDWVENYGLKSPLEKYGGGGFSGKENFFMALEWITSARTKGIKIPIICGGISCKQDVELARDFGANAVAFARITMTPFHAWKVGDIIDYANSLRWKKYYTT